MCNTTGSGQKNCTNCPGRLRFLSIHAYYFFNFLLFNDLLFCMPVMKRRFLFLCLSTLLIFCGLASFRSAAATDLRDDVLSEVNKLRSSKGLPELVMDDDLNAIAQKHSENMARGKVRFGHSGFSSRSALARKKMGSNTAAFAENVAFGPATAEGVISLWKNSSGHRRNMLGQYRYAGIGVATDRKGTVYYTMIFLG